MARGGIFSLRAGNDNVCHKGVRTLRGNGFLYFALAALWAKTYAVQRFAFSLPVSGWKQEVLMALHPTVSVIALSLAVMWLAPRKLRAALVLAAFSTSCILYADLIFYRFFNDFITLPVLMLSDHMHQIAGSILALTQPGDAMLFADSALIAATAYRYKPAVVPWSVLKTAAAALLLALTSFFNYSLATSVRPDLLTRAFDRQILVRSIGAYNYHLYDALLNARMGARKAFANHADFERAEDYFSSLPPDSVDPATFGIARGRNVFLISLESLQSFMLGRSIDGREATPFLNKLAQESFTFENFYHQTAQGKTSDAEFLIDTSLYPLPTGAVFFTHAHNTYLSLPNLLKKHGYTPVALHANDPSFWNRGRMYTTLGYERFYSASDFAVDNSNSIGWGLGDIPFFEQSVRKIRGLPEPFFAKLITLTNHYPFELDEEHRLVPEFDSKSRTLNRYIPSVRYLDLAVEKFFETVKREGLYETSVFVLYGDHYGISTKHNKSMAKLLGKEKITPYDTVQLQRVPLIIHIPGVQGETLQTVGGQIDLYPTLLHLLGIMPDHSYYFGRDLFAAGRPEFVVFRDGSFATSERIYTKNVCYDRATGEKVEDAYCEPFKNKALEQLAASDAIVYGDLLRFGAADLPRKM